MCGAHVCFGPKADIAVVPLLLDPPKAEIARVEAFGHLRLPRGSSTSAPF